MAGQRDPIQEFLEQKVWAVVGVSRDPAKESYRVYCSLRDAGYRVYPVNPRATEIAGDRAYPSLGALPERPEVVDIITAPEVTRSVVAEAARLGLRRIWMQPGAESAEAIAEAEAAGMQVVHHACAMATVRRAASTKGGSDQ